MPHYFTWYTLPLKGLYGREGLQVEGLIRTEVDHGPCGPCHKYLQIHLSHFVKLGYTSELELCYMQRVQSSSSSSSLSPSDAQKLHLGLECHHFPKGVERKERNGDGPLLLLSDPLNLHSARGLNGNR